MAPFMGLTVLMLGLAVVLGLAGCGSEDESASAADESVVAADDGSDHDEHDEDDDGDHDEEAHGDDHDDDHDDDHKEEGSGLGSHEHGAAELSIAWSGGDMVIDLVSPTYNIFGFEYEPTTEEDQAIVAERTEAISAPGILTINAEAACDLTDDVLTELEYEGSHAELTASWLLSCENPAEIKQLDAGALFAEFPNLEDVDVQWASDAGQSSAELSPSAHIIDLE